MKPKPISFAVVGMNGYSRIHIDSILAIQRTDPSVCLAAVSTRRRENDEAYAQTLEREGVRIVASLDDLLAHKPKPTVLCVPTGIHLHRPMAMQGLRAGCAVVLEKPVAATVQDVDTLIAERDRTAQPLIVGFQHLAQERYWYAKQRLEEGIVGRIREVRGIAAAPRYVAYYQRAGWAGKMKAGDDWVLDSPINNAHAHYLLQCLLFAGAPGAVAEPATVTAELYRAQPIEGPDTAGLTIQTKNGIPVRFSASHAVDQAFGPEVTIVGDAANLIVTPDAVFLERDGNREQLDEPATEGNPFKAMISLLRGDRRAPYCSLEMARPHTLVINAAHLSCAVRPLPPESILQKAIDATDKTPADHQFYVKDLYAAMRQAYADGVDLHGTGRLDWTCPGVPIDADRLTYFDGPRKDT